MNYSTEERNMWLEDWKQSSLSAWAYARVNGLNPQTFVRWTKIENDAEPGFVEVSAEIVQEQHYPNKIVIEKGDVKIHIPCGIGRNELQVIMAGFWRTQ